MGTADHTSTARDDRFTYPPSDRLATARWSSRHRGRGGRIELLHRVAPIMIFRRVAQLLVLSDLVAHANGQSASPVELTAQAARQPVAWLINVEQASNAQASTATMQPAMSKLAQFYHSAAPQKGVRVAHVDADRSVQLRPILCEGAAVPSSGPLQVW